jgi:hypothetical protein
LVLYRSIGLPRGVHVSLSPSYCLSTYIPAPVVSGLLLTLLAILRLIKIVLASVPGRFRIPVLPLGYNSYLRGVPRYYKGVPKYCKGVSNYWIIGLYPSINDYRRFGLVGKS